MKEFINNYRGLPKEIYVICFSTFINRLGDFVVPFLTLYLTQKIGMTAIAAGFIVTVSSIIGIPASIIGGKFLDVFGRKKIYILSQSISALALIPCAITKNVEVTIIGLLLSTFFGGFTRPAIMAMATDILPKEKRQAGFSLQYLSINIGVSVGPIMAGFLFNNMLPMLFIADAITSFLGVILIWKYVKETYSKDMVIKVEHKAERAEKGNTIQMLLKRPHICLFMGLSILYNFVYNQHKFSLPITLNNQFNENGAKVFGYLMSVNAITVIVFTAFITVLTKKYHQLTNMVLAGVAYAIGFGMIAFINGYISFMISTIIWTMGEILSSISSGVYLANNSPSNYRARINAISSMGWFIGSAISTSFSGAYIEMHGSKNIWILTFILSAVGAILMFGLKEFSKKKAKENIIAV